MNAVDVQHNTNLTLSKVTNMATEINLAARNQSESLQETNDSCLISLDLYA